MKSLFNNPWFIAGIGIFALIYFGLTVVKPLLIEEGGSYVDTGNFDFFGDDTAVNTSTGAAKSSIQGREDIGWLYDLDRDPFSGTLLSIQSNQSRPLPKLEALFLGAGVQAAVVNNRLVYVGDIVDHYKVTHIAAQHVQVSHRGRSYRLEPDV